MQVLGLQRSFSCGDIVSVPSWPPQLLHARSDSWLVSADCDYSWGGPGGGPLARLDANSRYQNLASGQKYLHQAENIYSIPRSLSTWVAVGDVDEVNSQLPSPHVEMIKVGDSFIIQTNPNCCKLQVIHKL